MLDMFQRIGRDLFLTGMVSSHGGNMSVRMGGHIFITRRGSNLAWLEERDIVKIGLREDDSSVMLASSEIVVHRAIYESTTALAIVHTHPPHAIVRSFMSDEIVPIDSEGSYLLKRVPVVATELTVGSAEVAKVVSKELKDYPVVMLRGHGAFAIGNMLEEAYQWTSAFEGTCKILVLSEGTRDQFKEYRKGSDQYASW
jgi:L-fuculose-phosphate aldolase